MRDWIGEDNRMEYGRPTAASLTYPLDRSAVDSDGCCMASISLLHEAIHHAPLARGFAWSNLPLLPTLMLSWGYRRSRARL